MSWTLYSDFGTNQFCNAADPFLRSEFDRVLTICVMLGLDLHMECSYMSNRCMWIELTVCHYTCMSDKEGIAASKVIQSVKASSQLSSCQISFYITPTVLKNR